MNIINLLIFKLIIIKRLILILINIFFTFISNKNRFTYEFIPILNYYKIPINICYGAHKYLKKITYKDDI